MNIILYLMYRDLLIYVSAMQVFLLTSFLSTSANTCYCEHPNERPPLNGIMCGDPSRGNYKRTGYCSAQERCTGPGNPMQGIDANRAKEALCETGRQSTIKRIFSGLYNKI